MRCLAQRSAEPGDTPWPGSLIGWAISQEYPERQEWTDRDELLVHEVFLRERQAFDEGPSLLRLIPRGIIMCWYRWVPQALESHKIHFTPYTHGGTIRYHNRQGEGDG